MPDPVAIWFPALRNQSLVETRVCQYENSVDRHFFVAQHPTLDNVWLVGGGSGTDTSTASCSASMSPVMSSARTRLPSCRKSLR
jgi:hypothetical protein